MKNNIILLIILSILSMRLYAQKETTYWDNGNLRNISNYENGEREGVNKNYYQNGQLQEVGSYINGEKDGEWKEYYTTGQLKGIASYKNGDLHGERKDYYKSGKLSYIANYENGHSIGKATEYNENGKIRRIITYNNGEFYKSDNKERRLVEFKTYSIDSINREIIEQNTANYLSRTDLTIKTEKNSNYSYAFGLKEKLFSNKLVKSLTVLLVKNNEVVSEISYNIDFESKSIYESYGLKGFNIEGVDEALEIGFGRGACGYGYHKALFFRKNDELINGVLASSFGEVESEYNAQEIIAPLHKEKNQVWVKNRTGHSTLLNNEYTEVNYFTEIEKYKYHDGKFVLINPKKDNIYYVTAKSGLRQRNRPFPTSDTLSLLKFGTKVKLLNKTDLEFKVNENGKIIKGHWVQIEVNDGSNPYISYVFDGYLNKMLTTIKASKPISNNKNGVWKWHYDNGQLKNSRHYTNDKYNGVYIDYYKNGKVKEEGNYSNGNKEGVWKVYHENGKLKEITPYKNGKIHGERTTYNYEGVLIESIYIEHGDLSKLLETYFYKNGQVIAIGHTDNGRKYGIWKKFYENGKLREINQYKNNNKDGEWKKYYSSGQLLAQGQYIKGDRDGKFIWYGEDGKIKRAKESKYNSPYVWGEWEYFNNGQLKSVELYQRDELVEWKYYYDNGQLKEVRQYYKKRTRTGEWKYYYRNGQLRLLAHYKDELPQGEFKLYHENGQLYKTQILKYYKKLMEINSCFNAKGNTLDKGTLKKGTGTVKEYNAKGELINIATYKEGEKIEHSVSVDEIWNNSDKLNSLAWKYYKEENSPIKLNWAVKWVQRSIELNKYYHNMDTHAALLYKTGKYKKALKVANKAIKIAKKTKNNFKATKELIEKINKKI